MPAALSARAAYRRWYAATGPWAGFFRAVPLVALARGVVTAPGVAPPGPEGLTAVLRRAGTQEGWLGRPDVLLVLDLPGAASVAAVAGLARWGVRPVLLLFQWPEPGALLPVDPLLAALLCYAPRPSRPGGPESRPAQYAFVLERERTGAAGGADLAARFDNRYALGAVDLPTAARLRAGGIGALVACRRTDAPPAPDLAEYLDGLEAGGLPLRRLALD